jgi:hypothetical protein
MEVVHGSMQMLIDLGNTTCSIPNRFDAESKGVLEPKALLPRTTFNAIESRFTVPHPESATRLVTFVLHVLIPATEQPASGGLASIISRHTFGASTRMLTKKHLSKRK